MTKKLFFYCFVQVIITLSEYGAAASIIIPVSNDLCRYNITIPDGWDTIPQNILKDKLPQFIIERGIYPVSQDDYFSGNYALISFLPTVSILNNFTFKQILSDITRVNNESEFNTDTLRIHFKTITPVIQNRVYTLQSYFSILKDSVLLDNCQLLYLTKYGYVSVLSYAKEGALPLDKATEKLSNLISVEPDFQYFEPQKEGLTFKNILISLIIGVIVFLIIMFFPQVKKKLL